MARKLPTVNVKSRLIFINPRPELLGASYRKMPKSVLKKENWFDFTIETSIDFKKGQILNKF